ncbi:MAG: alpha-L-rhamnosidase N-terminal domain-containing protein [Subdoligranulum sp.]
MDKLPQAPAIPDLRCNAAQRQNHLTLTLANGWYKGKLGFMPQPNHYGDTTAALAALCITYEDGHEEWIGTDESWFCTIRGHSVRRNL